MHNLYWHKYKWNMLYTNTIYKLYKLLNLHSKSEVQKLENNNLS